MLPYRDSRITKIALGVFFLMLVGYAYFEARGIIYGPSITVPSERVEIAEQFIIIRGKAERISELRMNGKSIGVTEAGTFAEPYLLAPGLNRIILDAKDKYGRERQEIIEILYTPSQGFAPVEESASSSPLAP
ncbi:MAG TPA: hypothetical protein VJB97_04380 [Candidatus Paceibacterota bacterium]